MENTQKTHFIAYKLPIGLLMILAIFGIGHSVRIPHNMPIGTINTVGICYYASAKQLFDAALYSLGSSIDPIVNSETKDDLFGAYLATRQAAAEYKGVPSIRADIFAKEWVEKFPETYKQPFILKKVRNADGSITCSEMFPEKVGTGSGGYPHEVVDSLLESFHMRCEESGLLDPFAIATLAGRSSKEAQSFSILMYRLPGEQNNKQEANTAYLQGTNLKYSGKILRAPRILTLMPEKEMEQHATPLYLTLHDSKGDKGQYRLLGVAVGMPIIDPKKGFDANHAIAIVRYNNLWYRCDNHEIVPFESEAAVAEWIDTNARTSYEGSNMSAALPGTVVSALMYELVSKGTESKGNIKS